MTGPASPNPRPALHSTGTRRFRRFAFEIRADEARVAAYLDGLFREFEHTDHASDTHDFTVLTLAGRGRLEIDGEPSTTDPFPGQIVSTVVHALTRQMISTTDALSIHAGGVVRDGVGVALPASMESGKSTLTTGLVRAGFSYWSDEAVLVDWDGGGVIPFPKPISLDPGSWLLFPELEPQADLPDGYKAAQWHVPPAALRPDAVAAPCPIRLVVFPKYAEGVRTRVTPITRGEATIELAKNTFRFNESPRRSIDALANVARGAECFRLDVGDLDAAVELVSELVERRA